MHWYIMLITSVFTIYIDICYTCIHNIYNLQHMLTQWLQVFDNVMIIQRFYYVWMQLPMQISLILIHCLSHFSCIDPALGLNASSFWATLYEPGITWLPPCKRWCFNAGIRSGQLRRRWANINPSQCTMLALLSLYIARHITDLCDKCQ